MPTRYNAVMNRVHFLWYWVTANVIGWLLFGAFSLINGGTYGIVGALPTVASGGGWPVSWLGGGALLGAAQWWVLRRHMPRTVAWIPATTAGWVAGWAIGAATRPVWGVLALGVAMAAAQAWVLRDQLPQTWQWVALTLAGWLLFGAADEFARAGIPGAAAGWLALVIGGAAYALTTGQGLRCWWGQRLR